MFSEEHERAQIDNIRADTIATYARGAAYVLACIGIAVAGIGFGLAALS